MRTFRVQVEQTATGIVDFDLDDDEDSAGVEPRAVRAVMDGDLTPRWEYGTVGAVRSWPRGSACVVVDPTARTPWCRIHDEPMQDDGLLCYLGAEEPLA